MKYTRKKKKKQQYIPKVYVPTFLGARLNLNNYNQLLTWPEMQNVKLS